MANIKLADTSRPSATCFVAVNPWLDWAASTAIVLLFTGFAFAGVAGIPYHLPIAIVHQLLVVAASIANVMFVSLVAATTLTRLAPIGKARGLEPRISAVLGSFLCIALTFLPRVDLSPVASIISTLLIITGT